MKNDSIDLNYVASKSTNNFSVNVRTNKFFEKLNKITKPIKRPSKFNFFNKHLEKLMSQVLLYELIDYKKIKKLAKNNSEVIQILKKNDLELEINISNLETIFDAHLNPTLEIANAIVENLKDEINFSVQQRKDIIKGAIFHDFGKVLIPSSIINKKGKLNEAERKIIELHTELGYQLLKSANILSEKALNIVRNHHKYIDGSGYPEISTNLDLISQIVTVADIFSALISKRSYKDSFSNNKALEILREKVQNGKISKKIVKALEKHLNEKN